MSHCFKLPYIYFHIYNNYNYGDVVTIIVLLLL